MDESPEPDNLIAKQCETMSKPKKLLMVNQIWLWKTNSSTYLTFSSLVMLKLCVWNPDSPVSYLIPRHYHATVLVFYLALNPSLCCLDIQEMPVFVCISYILRRCMSTPLSGVSRLYVLFLLDMLTSMVLDTFITAFPDRWHQSRNADLLTHITQNISGDLPPTLNSMIIQILHHTIGFVDAPRNAGLDENIFDIFEQSIAHRVCFAEINEMANHADCGHTFVRPIQRRNAMKSFTGRKIIHRTVVYMDPPPGRRYYKE